MSHPPQGEEGIEKGGGKGGGHWSCNLRAVHFVVVGTHFTFLLMVV